jgi:hypothetical protein
VWLNLVSDVVNDGVEELQVKIWAHCAVHKYLKWQEPSLLNFANFNLDGVAYIRANSDDDDGDNVMGYQDNDGPNENDLLMLTLDFRTHNMPPNIQFRIRRDDIPNLRMWPAGPRKGPIDVRNPPLLDARTKERILPFPTGKRILNLWVEWTARPDLTSSRDSVLTFEAFDTVNNVVVSSSRVWLKPFTGMVIVFGGLDQQPQEFYDDKKKPNLGIYDIAKRLYRAGYDVLTHEPGSQFPRYKDVLEELRKAIGDKGVSPSSCNRSRADQHSTDWI